MYFKILFICCFVFLLKETKYLSVLCWLVVFWGVGVFLLFVQLSLLSPVVESFHPSDPISFCDVLVLPVGCLGRDPWKEMH